MRGRFELAVIAMQCAWRTIVGDHVLCACQKSKDSRLSALERLYAVLHDCRNFLWLSKRTCPRLASPLAGVIMRRVFCLPQGPFSRRPSGECSPGGTGWKRYSWTRHSAPSVAK